MLRRLVDGWEMVCWVGKLPVSGYQLEAARRGMSHGEATRSPPCPYEVGRPFIEGLMVARLWVGTWEARPAGTGYASGLGGVGSTSNCPD
ncbi:MAG: hypothetical protein R3E39_10895 [Anaerolineae bacterium]